MVIATDNWEARDHDEGDDGDDHGTPFEEKIAIAEECRSHLFNVQNEAARREERARQLAAEGGNNAQDGGRRMTKQLTAEGENNAEDGGSGESQIVIQEN
jgi:hypothetical protein